MSRNKRVSVLEMVLKENQKTMNEIEEKEREIKKVALRKGIKFIKENLVVDNALLKGHKY